MCLAERLVLKIPRSISLGKYYTISVVYASRVCLILSFKQLTILLNLLLLCLQVEFFFHVTKVILTLGQIKINLVVQNFLFCSLMSLFQNTRLPFTQNQNTTNPARHLKKRIPKIKVNSSCGIRTLADLIGMVTHFSMERDSPNAFHI